MMWVYLVSLCVALSGLATLDWRYKLAFWYDTRRTSLTIGCGVVIFTVWDLLGIGLDIFHHGNSSLTLPIRLLPELPIEELFFLALLCYTTLLLYRGATR